MIIKDSIKIKRNLDFNQQIDQLPQKNYCLEIIKNNQFKLNNKMMR